MRTERSIEEKLSEEIRRVSRLISDYGIETGTHMDHAVVTCTEALSRLEEELFMRSQGVN